MEEPTETPMVISILPFMAMKTLVTCCGQMWSVLKDRRDRDGAHFGCVPDDGEEDQSDECLKSNREYRHISRLEHE